MKSIIIFFLIIIVNSLHGQKVIHTSAPVNDFIIDNNSLIVATTNGVIYYYNLENNKLDHKINFDKTKDFAGDLFDTEIFKIVFINKVLIAVVRGENGFNDIYAINNKKKELLISGSEINSVVVDIAGSYDKMLLLGLLSNELIKYDIISKHQIYRKQISNYAFSAMCISDNGTNIFATDESGVVHKVQVDNGSLIKEYQGQNVDNVLCIDYSNGVIVCGGKDRRVAFYNTKSGSNSYLNTDKFITTIAISPSANAVVWYDTETNNLELYNTTTRLVTQLKGHTSMVNKIVFTSDKTLVSAGIDNKVIFWKLN